MNKTLKLFSILAALSSVILTSCNKTNSGDTFSSGNVESQSSETTSEWIIDPEQPIDLTKKYVLENYLDKRFRIFSFDLIFVIKDTYSTPEYEYTPASFIPEKFLPIVRQDDYGFVKQDYWHWTYFTTFFNLEDDGVERYAYLIRFQGIFGVKDLLDLLEESKTKDYIFFVTFHMDGGVKPIPPSLDIPEDRKPLEESMMGTALCLFDDKHNFLDGYYNEFNVCLVKQATGYKDYSFQEVFPTFSQNTEATFGKVVDSNAIKILDDTLPESAEKAQRDWYKVTFPFRMEAQFALQMFKNLYEIPGIFYATASLCEDESLPIQIPLFRLYQL